MCFVAESSLIHYSTESRLRKAVPNASAEPEDGCWVSLRSIGSHRGHLAAARLVGHCHHLHGPLGFSDSSKRRRYLYAHNHGSASRASRCGDAAAWRSQEIRDAVSAHLLSFATLRCA